MTLRILACLAAAALASSAAAAPPSAAAPTYAVVDRIAGPDGGWDLLGVDAAHRLYVARSGAVMAADLSTGQVTPSLIPLTRGHAAFPIPGTSRVLATNGASGSVVTTLATGKRPDAVAYDPATRTVRIMNAGSGDITVVDAATLAVAGTVAVGGSFAILVVAPTPAATADAR